MTDTDNVVGDGDDLPIDMPDRPEYMLTTYDNPFDPFTEWDQWFGWDVAAGYHTPGFLARVVQTSPDLSEGDQSLAIQEAIDEIVRENVRGVYQKVARGQHAKFGTQEASTLQ